MLLTKQNEKLKKRLSNDKTTCVYREMHNCWRDLILPLFIDTFQGGEQYQSGYNKTLFKFKFK